MKVSKILGSVLLTATLTLTFQPAELLAQEPATPEARTDARTQETRYVLGGATFVKLAPAFINALGSLRIFPSAVGPGALISRSGALTAAFPITTGAVDPSPVFAVLDHSGGLSLATVRNRASITSFIIDSKTGQLSGLVTCDSNLVGRVPLFNLRLTQAPRINDLQMTIDDVSLTLTSGAASALSNCLGRTIPPIEIGSAQVRAMLGPRL
ncbi:hypothetical protein LG047_16480 [Methylocystis sp. WRRC1]|uniref:hypothetical protein n=1 Tax=Methylocystis sp. WRRC1 TaxID=1732014 RepID=UPI001D14F4BF|nr:hypothetical protein [Methylocystis sp. WRRC1]MCC3246892.1 hypothetical protein [Methylocystis sp. WRRC1]